MEQEKNLKNEISKEQEEFKKLLADASNSGLSCLIALSALFRNPCFKHFVENYFKPTSPTMKVEPKKDK